MTSAGTFALALLAITNVAHAEEFDVGPWYLDVEQDRAIAALDDPDQNWTLMVRCSEHHIDMLVRKRAEPPEQQNTIHEYQGSLQADGGSAIAFSAQTYSQDGFLVPSPSALLSPVQDGLQLSFEFAAGPDRTRISFLAGHSRQALNQIMRMCEQGVS